MNRVKKVITIDKEIVSGTPVFKGTRIPVYILFDYLWNGDPFGSFSKDFPQVTKKQLQEAIAIASEIFNSGKLASLYETATRRTHSGRAKTRPKKPQRIHR